jgi:hypothetical protein
MNSSTLSKINDLLLEFWDPIGVRNTKGAEDEYIQYANDIYEIIRHSKSHAELFEYLWELQTEHMGLRGNRIKTEEFARLLFIEVKKLVD